jgi:histidinol phosphatase-like PHP family hydrolase
MINPKLCSLSAELATMLDYRLVSCNHYHLKHVENATPPSADAYAGHYLDMLHGAIDLGFADTIGHPFYHQKLHKKYGPELLHATLMAYDETRLTETLQRAAQVNMAFEINPRHADLALDWFKALVQEARLHGTKFTIGTDAHAIKSLGYPVGTTGRTCQDVLKDLTITDKDLKWKPIKFKG